MRKFLYKTYCICKEIVCTTLSFYSSCSSIKSCKSLSSAKTPAPVRALRSVDYRHLYSYKSNYRSLIYFYFLSKGFYVFQFPLSFYLSQKFCRQFVFYLLPTSFHQDLLYLYHHQDGSFPYLVQ